MVKADGYGHGAGPCARAALAGGADWLAVATAREAASCAPQGIDARLLVMGALSAEELAVALAADADVVAWDEGFVAALAGASAGARARQARHRDGAAGHPRPGGGATASPRRSPPPRARAGRRR